MKIPKLKKTTKDTAFAIISLLTVIASFALGVFLALGSELPDSAKELMKSRYAFALDISSHGKLTASDYLFAFTLEEAPIVILFLCAFDYLCPLYALIALFCRSLLCGYACCDLNLSYAKAGEGTLRMLCFALFEAALMLICASFAREANEFSGMTIRRGAPLRKDKVRSLTLDFAFFIGISFALFILRSLFCTLL